MKSTLALLVGTVLVTAMTQSTQAAATAPSPAKEAACNAYTTAMYDGTAQDKRLDLIVEALNVAGELNYTPEQSAKLRTHFDSLIKLNPKKMDDFDGAAYFVCTTDLTPEDKATMREQFAAALGI